MSVPFHDHVLAGCRPEPLAFYLKALAVLRLVSEQKDATATGHWRGDSFVLRTALSREQLVRFFTDEYRPTAVVAPWNGGSGFYPKDNKEASKALLSSDDVRVRPIADSIRIAAAYIEARRWTQRPEDEDKRELIEVMRSRLPDEALPWLDAAIILGDGRLLFPPLLGSGGNDGRLDFSNNFQQRVVEVVANADPLALDASLFGVAAASKFKGTMGLYLPAAGEKTNPWDFVLLIEGALTFGAAATRRYEVSAQGPVLSFPFHARAAGGLATITDWDETESRDELWLPMWTAPASYASVSRLFAEGRATVGHGAGARTATTGLDFARAVSALGVDRGVDEFVRVGFHVRNGLSCYATPLGRFKTASVASARPLDEIDAWFQRFRRAATDKHAPERIARARRRLEAAMFESASRGALAPVLLALGETEAAISHSLRFATDRGIDPIPRLSPAWGAAADDGSVEYRLAAALASKAGMRGRLVPLDREATKYGRTDDFEAVFTERELVESLITIAERDDLAAAKEMRAEIHYAHYVLSDLRAFIHAEVDDRLTEQWLRALVLVKGVATRLPSSARPVPAAFAVLALAYHRRLGSEILHRTTGIVARARAGDSDGATRLAIRRLHSSGRPFPVDAIAEPGYRTRRIAAALAFPLSSSQRHELEHNLFATSSGDQP